MTGTARVVFLLDVDNTLLYNDRVIEDLNNHLRNAFGTDCQRRYWAIFEKRREELGYADYLGALQRYRAENLRDPRFIETSFYLLEYPFAARVFADSLAVIRHLDRMGPTVILSDGDVVFQPHKVQCSGLYRAVEGRMLIYIHKEQELDDVESHYPAEHYVLVDDKLRVLDAAKRFWGSRVTTVFPRQGHYAHDPKLLEKYPPADITIDHIGDLIQYDLPALITAGRREGSGGNATALNVAPEARTSGTRVLVIDVGGTHVKILATGQETRRRFDSGPSMTGSEMVAGVLEAAKGWRYDAVSIGYPGRVARNRPVAEPYNLGTGWVGFDFAAAFGCPVKVINDAAMQALGSYEGGSMLFLGLGTGFGSAMVVDGVVQPMELGHLPYKKETYEDYVGIRGLRRLGKKKWRRCVEDVVRRLVAALEADDVVLGGGNVNKLKELPPGCRRGENANAFRGGFRLWEQAKEQRDPASPESRQEDKQAVEGISST